jgi:hypothetical protein
MRRRRALFPGRGFPFSKEETACAMGGAYMPLFAKKLFIIFIKVS